MEMHEKERLEACKMVVHETMSLIEAELGMDIGYKVEEEVKYGEKLFGGEELKSFAVCGKSELVCVSIIEDFETSIFVDEERATTDTSRLGRGMARELADIILS